MNATDKDTENMPLFRNWLFRSKDKNTGMNEHAPATTATGSENGSNTARLLS
jgi:hypothetical protein